MDELPRLGGEAGIEPPARLLGLFHLAQDRLDETQNDSAVMPFASEAIALVLAHPECRDAFEEAFKTMPARGIEFVSVCMHVLRWPSLKDHWASAYRAGVDARRGPGFQGEAALRRLLDSFEPDWADIRDIYRDFPAQAPGGAK